MVPLASCARIRSTRLAAVLAALAILVAVPAPAVPTPAQRGTRVRCAPVFYWGVDVGTATISVFLQGRSRGVPVGRAIVGGVAGGSVMYAGQRLVGTGVPALRFAGLQSVAVGASLARNLGTGRGALDELTLPVFPLYVQRLRGARPEWSARLSVVAVAGVVRTVHEFKVWPDWRESLLAGLPVFEVPRERLGGCSAYGPRGECLAGMLGHHVVGAVVYAGRPEQTTVQDILTHELGHSAQDVRDAVLHAVPASDFVLRRHPVGRWLSRFIVVDVVLPLELVSRAVGPPGADPACRELSSFYECETEAMKPALP